MREVMPYVLSVIGVMAMLTIGRNHWYGWAIAFTNECLWLIFAITTTQYGFILGAAIYGAVNAYNAYNWRQEHKQEKANAD